MLSTKELGEKLGVSRAWINTYLRPLGVQGVHPEDKANIRTVYYDESRVVDYLNAHATFSRQTECLNLADYMDEDKLRSRLQEIKAIEDKRVQETMYWSLMAQILPGGVRVIAEPWISARSRGRYQWRPVKCQIRSLDALRTMGQLCDGRSTELIYRDNFEFGRIKVVVHGRTWFMAAEDGAAPDLSVLIRAREP